MSAAIKRAIEGGCHVVDFKPDGSIRILPIGPDSRQIDIAALDAEIREFIGHGDDRP